MVDLFLSFSLIHLLDEEYEEDSIEMKQNDELFEKFSEPIFYG